MMNELFASVPLIGELYYKTTYIYYDEPQLFSCITSTMQTYIIISIPTEVGEDAAWLAAPISSGKLTKLEKNLIDIREAFAQPESLLWKIYEKEESFYARTINPSLLTDDFLPVKGVYLDYKGKEELHISTTEPLERAREEMRDIIEISIEKDDAHISEIPCETLSEVLDDVQQLMYAIAYKDGGLRGAIPLKIRESSKLLVTDMFAASVGIRMKSNEYCDIHMETPLTATLKKFNMLFDISDDKDALHKFISEQNPRVAIKYRKLIRTLITSNTGVNINNASPDNSTFLRHYSTKDLAKKLELVNSQVEEISEVHTFYGNLVGVNVERNSFEFKSADGENIRGLISPDLRENQFSVPESVEIVVEVRIGTDSFTKEEKLVYTLQSIKPLILETQ